MTVACCLTSPDDPITRFFPVSVKYFSTTMPAISHPTISQQIQELALQAGLSVAGAGSGTDFTGAPTAKLQLKSPSGSTYSIETSEALSVEIEKRAPLGEELKTYLQTLAKRMQTARPDVFLTLHGLPLSMQQFSWPYHRSTSGADSFILHGIAQLAEPGSPLHAKIAASLTVTFAEVLPALEQPYAEGVTFNAIRKTLDLGQLELLKSGNRQPVPVSTRYYSFRQQRFIFSETDENKRKEFVRAKVFWTSARLGEGKPSWIADPYDAQYLDCSTEDLVKIARELASEGLLTLDSCGEYAVASAKLSAQADQFVKQMESALALLKPKFNEEMRAGHTNM
jgi:hypothetical protein